MYFLILITIFQVQNSMENWPVTFNTHQIRNLIQISQKFRIQFKITAERIFSLQEINKIYH
jgi:hypothetical protein